MYFLSLTNSIDYYIILSDVDSDIMLLSLKRQFPFKV